MKIRQKSIVYSIRMKIGLKSIVYSINNGHSSFVSGQYDDVFFSFQSFPCLSFVFSQVTVKFLVFNKNNYNKDFVRRNTYKKTGPNVTNNNATPVTTVTIPYVKGTSETIARILQPYSIRVAHKPITTLRQLLTKVKDKDEPNRRQGGAVYKIKCCDCQATELYR